MKKTPGVYTISINHGLVDDVPLVMLHGHGGDHRGLMLLAKNLRRNVYLADLPGFGKSSDIESFSIDNCSAVLTEHVRSLIGGKYDLLGHSMGSAVALGVAACDPKVRSLTMVNAIPKFAMTMKVITRGAEELALHLPEPIARQAIHSNFYNLATYMIHSQKKYNPSALRDYIVSQKQVNYSLRAWHEAGRAVYDMDQRRYAERVKVPVLMIGGDHDRMSTIESVKNFSTAFRLSQLEIIAGAGHFIPQENYGEASETIDKFLASLDGRPLARVIAK